MNSPVLREIIFTISAKVNCWNRENGYHWVNLVLVVDVDEATQIRRLTARDKINEAQAQAILDSQASRSQRLAIADDVIVNDAELESLKADVGVLYKQYLGMVRG